MEKIKMLQPTHDFKTKKPYAIGAEVDLGKERNENAVKKGLAVWVDSREFTEAKKEIEQSEKKEGTPKKTTTSVKGKKIETK